MGTGKGPQTAQKLLRIRTVNSFPERAFSLAQSEAEVSQLSDAIRARWSGAATAEARPAAVEKPAPPIDIHQLNSSLYTLAQLSTEILSKSVQHFQTKDVWLIGSMPGFNAEADRVEAQGRAFLANSHLDPELIEIVARVMRDSWDLRAVARSARHAAQLSWLLRQECGGEDPEELLRIIRGVGEQSLVVAKKSVLAIAAQNSQAASWAALRYREIDSARFTAEELLVDGALTAQFSPTMRRMTRAAMWYMAIAGECMARLAARTAQVTPAPTTNAATL